MTVNSFSKLLSYRDVNIFLANSVNELEVKVQKVEYEIIPRYVTLFTYENDDAKSFLESRGRNKHNIIIWNNEKSKKDLQFMASRFKLYREAEAEGAVSVMECYEPVTDEWFEVAVFDNLQSRMLKVREIDNDPNKLLLKMWGKRCLTPMDRLSTMARCMFRDAAAGLLPDYLKPYFKWKHGECKAPSFSLHEADEMYDRAEADLEAFYEKYPGAINFVDYEHLDDPWRFNAGFGDDKRMVSYLQIISDELASLRASGILLGSAV